ncbi:integrase core domain-containing protein [Acidobacteria bacterium AH-259-G07]|nr:integrase core domain-containing protein [Acidobacteria bacterium AH-259-G07]
MTFILHPWQLLIFIMAGWINRHQQDAIEYLRTENQVLKEKLGKRRILLNDDQRRRLAVKGKVLTRKTLKQVATIVTPDTILRWHRELIARKWDHTDKRQSVGRPRVRPEIVTLTVRMAQENPSWGYDRIQGALANVGFHVSDTTVANILKAHGIEPAPQRQRRTSWRTFLNAHWDSIAAADFTTVEVWTRSGLVTFYVFVVMHLKTRRVEIAGVTPHPNAAWMRQIGRNLTDCVDGFLRTTGHLIIDRDTKHLPLREILKSTKIDVVILPPKSPNLNAHLERFIHSLKSECLDHVIFFGEDSLRRALEQFSAHFHRERNHQGLDNRIIDAGEEVGRTNGELQCRKRLGGMLRYYYRDAS